MNQKKSSAVLKSLAKEQLLGNYSTLSSGLLIILSIFFVLFMITFSIMGTTLTTATLLSSGGMSAPFTFTMIVYFLILFIITILFYTMEIGLLVMALKLSRGEKTDFKDIFFCFKNHPDKVIIIYLITFFVSFLASAPAFIVDLIYVSKLGTTYYTSPYFLLYCVLYIFSQVITVMFGLTYGLSYFYYADDPLLSPIECMRLSRISMKGNKGRLFYIALSFIGWYLLIFLTCGIASFWIIPYALTVIANFYRDIRNEFDASATIDIKL